MRRGRALGHGRWVSLLLAGIVGFLLGDWHALNSRPAGLSPSQHIAMRFPEPKIKSEPAAAEAAAEQPTGAVATGAGVFGGQQIALLSPDPMVPVRKPLTQPVTQAAQPPVQTALPEPSSIPAPAQAAPLPAAKSIASPRVAMVAPQARPEPKPVPDAGAHRAGRQGFMLNDGQIASIKARLRLTPDQEQMWPAVEAALRNIAYARAREARRPGAAANTSLASLDPDSDAVQGLKSAAVPLIMSFNDDQKNQVRSLAHVMGLDRLASAF